MILRSYPFFLHEHMYSAVITQIGYGGGLADEIDGLFVI